MKYIIYLICLSSIIGTYFYVKNKKETTLPTIIPIEQPAQKPAQIIFQPAPAQITPQPKTITPITPQPKTITPIIVQVPQTIQSTQTSKQIKLEPLSVLKAPDPKSMVNLKPAPQIRVEVPKLPGVLAPGTTSCITSGNSTTCISD